MDFLRRSWALLLFAACLGGWWFGPILSGTPALFLGFMILSCIALCLALPQLNKVLRLTRDDGKWL
jgi:hypothetical protein